MNPQLLFCATDPTTGRVNITVVDTTNGDVKHGTIETNKIVNWLGQNISLTAAAPHEAAAGQQQRRAG